MKYNRFTPNTPKISEIGLGAWQLGENSGWTSLTEAEAIRMVHKALDSGINFFDTAPNYGNGTSEARLGKALKHTDRSKIVINSKFGHTVNGELNYSADYIRESLEGSLKRLDTHYLDSLIIHSPPSEYLDGTIVKHYEILDKFKDEGLIRAYGASVDTFEDMKLLMKTTQSQVIEAFFNILHQDTAQAFEMAIDKKVAIIAKIPLDSGWLSGKYDEHSRFEGIRSRWSENDIKLRAELVDTVREIIGEEHSVAKAALSFCLSYDAISTVIPGTRNTDQLKQNIESTEYSIPKDIVIQLEEFYKSKVASLRLPW